jgi:hypothetical protein
VAGPDPLVYLVAWLTVVGGLGVLILMWATSAAVFGFFLRHRRKENFWRAQVAPVFAFLLLTGVLAATVIGLGELLQVTPDSPFRWLFPTAYALIAVFGFGWALIMRGLRPEVYKAIGRGTDGRLLSMVDIPRTAHVERVMIPTQRQLGGSVTNDQRGYR